MSADGMQTVLITGASSGLGLALTRELLLRPDYRLVLTAREESIPRFADAAIDETDRVHIRQLRVNEDTERRALIAEIDEKWGGVDILVNNAGVAYRSVVEHIRQAELARQMEINFDAPLQLIRLVLPGMRKRKFGKIINISSVSGMLAMPTMSPYCASKYALEGITEALWYEVRPWNIRVTLVQPGFIRSDSFKNTRLTEKSEASFEDDHEPYHDHYLGMDSLIKRFMDSAFATPEKVARKICRVMDSSRPPLRVPATIDAYAFNMLRRLLPQRVFHLVLRRALPGVSKWGVNGEVEP